MESRRNIITKLILGGALLCAFLLPVFAFSYSQNTTHPALTNAIVDFHNASFPSDKLSYEEKQWLIKGSIDEDDNLRFFSHFYDPVYDRGLQSILTAGSPTFSSKKWALGDTQKNFYNSQMTGYAAISGADSAHDFSYDRALRDYAKGDKQRAFVAFGHVLHLLQDAGVPDHARNDPHPPVLDLGSPYEHEMHKWNPENFQIISRLIREREKPINLSDISSYLDKVANYSNNNFFSKDTIFVETYNNPIVDFWRYQGIGKTEKIVGYKNNKNDSYVLVEQILPSKVYTINKVSILDGYWERLSKEVVISGAGALRLFLEEAEKARTEYLAKAEQKKPSFWAQIMSLFGLTTSDDQGTSDVNGTASDVNDDGLTTSDVHNLPVVSDDGDSTGDSGDTNGDRKVSPSPSLILSPSPKVSPSPTPTPTPVDNLKQSDGKININTAGKAELDTLEGIGPSKAQGIIDYRTTNGQFQRIEDIMNVSGIGQATFDGIKDQITVGDIVPTPTPKPVVYGGGGGGGSSGGGNQTPSPTPTPTPSPEPEGDIANAGDVLINEIAWMGTSENSLCEWVELRNITSGEINLAGWKLYEQDGSVEIISLTQKISPNGYYLIERVTPTCPDAVPSVEADDSGSFVGSGLNNTDGEKLTLKDVADTTINEVDGSNGWKINGSDEIIGDNTSKKTAQKISGSWVTATATPKAANAADPVVQAPSAVTDFAAAHGSPTITATWTAPDPGAYSPASLSYDMRYSLTNLTASGSWDAATKVASSSLPAVAEKGASQSATFDIAYEYGQTYYFGLKTKLSAIPTCDVGYPQCSGVSNLATVSFSTAIDNDAWGMAGKDQYHTSLATTAGPGATATISWEFDASEELQPGYIVSQPVADADGNVFFGAANGSSGKLVKLDKNGLESWAEPYETNVSIGIPAVLSDGTVYFGRVGAGGSLAFTSLNSDGTKKWDYAGASTIKSVVVNSNGEPHFTYTSGSQKKLVSLNPDGTEKLNKSSSDVAGNPVVLENGDIIVAGRAGGGSHLITAYDEDGAQLWQVSTLESISNTLADPSHDTATGTTYSAAGPRLFAIPQDGSSINSTAIAPSDYAVATPVAITGDTLYAGFNNTNPASGSLLYALNKSGLSKKWAEPFEADGQLNNQLVVDSGGNTYFSTTNGKLYGVDPAGSQLWPPVETGSNSTISPVLTEHGLVWGWGSKIVLIND